MGIDLNLIKEIQQYLKVKTGKYYFKDIRLTPDNIILTCPFHKNGQETKPSATIRTTEGERTYIGNFHCFTCGKSLSLINVLKELLGSNFNKEEIDNRFGLDTIYIKSIYSKPNIVPFKLPSQNVITEASLRKYRYYSSYLKTRGISEDTSIKYDIGFDSSTNEITFPIRDINKNVLGIGRRNIYYKRYVYPTSFVKPLYGVYELPQFINNLWIRRRTV